MGILGLSPPTSILDISYSLVLDSMVSQGLIASRAFSLDLRSVTSPNGSLIFGGVDTGKYTGSLAKLPIVDSPSGATRYWVNMTSVGLTLPNGTSGLLASGELPVFLDSGGTQSRFPNETFFAIGDAMPGAVWNETIGYYIVDCATGDQPGSVDFGFGEKVISISYKDFFWNPGNEGQCVLGMQIENGKPYRDQSLKPALFIWTLLRLCIHDFVFDEWISLGSWTCCFLFCSYQTICDHFPRAYSNSMTTEEPVLGDSFLRAAYVVYDQDNANLHLAQAEDCGEDIIPIESGSDAVPSSIGQCTGPTGTVASTPLFGTTEATMAIPTSTSASGCDVSTSMGSGSSVMTGAPTETGGATGTETPMDSTTEGGATETSSGAGTTSSGTAVQVNIMARETSNPMAAFGLAAAAAVLLA